MRDECGGSGSEGTGLSVRILLDWLLTFLMAIIFVVIGGLLVWFIGHDIFNLSFGESVGLTAIYMVVSSCAESLNISLRALQD